MSKRKKLSSQLNNVFNAANDSFSPLSLGNLAAWYKPGYMNLDRSSDYTSDYVFNAELKNSLILTSGAGDPTFTRASVATVVDFEGLVKNCLSGEARFTGARRVGNLFATTSEDLSNAAWTKSNVAATYVAGDAPSGLAGYTELVTSAAGWYCEQVLTMDSTKTFRVSGWVRLPTGTTSTGALFSGLSNTGWDTLTGGFKAAPATNVWVRFSGLFTISAGTSFNFRLGAYNVASTIDSTTQGTLHVAGLMMQDVTGQSNQNPSEYVSVGVESAPYHGAGVDGVKYFTTENGNTVASNVVTEATGAAIADATLKGYLAEGARTNLCLQSENLNGGPWASGGSSTTVNATAAPDGATTADKFVESALNELHEIYQGAVVSANTTHTVSVFFKAAERSNARLQWMVGGASSGVRVDANLAAGTLSGGTAMGTGTYSGSSITAFGNGWYRVTLTGILDAASTTGYIDIQPLVGGTPTYLGDGASGFYMWGAQLEASAEASSYIPTTTAAVTRAADVLTYPTSGNIDGTVGTAYAESYVPLYSGAAQMAVGLGAGAQAALYRNTSSNLGIYDTTTLLNDGAWTLAQQVKISSLWGGSTMAACIDGGSITTAAFDGNMSPFLIYIGRSTAGDELFGNIRNVRIWDKALPKYVLKTLTGGTGPSSSDLLVSVWEDASGNDRPLEQITAANQPIYLPYSGTAYGYLPGVGGNLFRTDDAAGNRFAGDVDFRVKAALNDWTAATQTLISKDPGGANRAFIWYLNAGSVIFLYSTDGTNLKTATSSAAVAFAAGSTNWIRITLASATGKINFYTSSDGSTWTPLGTEQTVAAGAIFDSTAPVDIGSFQGGAWPMTGKVYEAALYRGIAGTLTQNFSPSTFAETSTNGATAVASTGETWTLYSTGAKPAQIVKSASLLFDGTNDFLKTAAFTLNQPTTIYLVIKQISWTEPDYLLDGDATNSGVIYQATATPRVQLYAGAVAGANDGLAIATKGILAVVFNGASSLTQVNATTAVTGDAGAANMGAITLGCRGDNPDLFSNIQAWELIAFSAAHTAANRAQMISWLNSRYGTF